MEMRVPTGSESIGGIADDLNSHWAIGRGFAAGGGM